MAVNDMVNCQRSNINIKTDLVENLSIIIKYKSGLNINVIAVMVYIHVCSERVDKIDGLYV